MIIKKTQNLRAGWDFKTYNFKIQNPRTSEIFELPLQFILCLYIFSYISLLPTKATHSLCRQLHLVILVSLHFSCKLSANHARSLMSPTLCLTFLVISRKGDATTLQKTYSNNAENWILTFLGSYPKNPSNTVSFVKMTQQRTPIKN